MCLLSCVCVDFCLNNPFAYFLKYSQVFASKLPITPTFQGNKKSSRYRESTLYIIYDNKFVILLIQVVRYINNKIYFPVFKNVVLLILVLFIWVDNFLMFSFTNLECYSSIQAWTFWRIFRSAIITFLCLY